MAVQVIGQNPEIEKSAKKDWLENVNPKYLEVSFGNGCN